MTIQAEGFLSPVLPQFERFQNPMPKDMEQIVTWARNSFDDVKNARTHIERQWYLNLAFYFGKQNVVYRGTPNFVQGSGGSLFVPPAPYYRARPVINRIRPIVRTELTKLTAQKPTAYIIPASSEDRDLFAAQAGEQIWDSIYRRKRIAAVLRRSLFWTLTCGTGFMKCAWDGNSIDPESGLMGDFEYFPETPFHIFAPDFRTEEMEDQPWMIHAKLKTREELEIMFPGVPISQSGKSDTDILDDSWINLVGASSLHDKRSVLVLECWVKPGTVSLFPDGAMYTIVGDTVVQGQEGWPFEHQKFPVAKFDHIPSGKFYADSSIVDLIPLQREYNRTRGQIIEAKNRMAKPQLIAPQGSIDPSKMTSEPGQVILYQPGYDRPEPLPLQSIPNYVLQELDRIIVDMSDISGQHDISQGQVPPGVTAATAISYLQEQDESKLAHTFASVEEGMEKIAFLTLNYVKQYWDVDRTVRLVGADGSFDTLAFKGSDLRSNDDIRIEAGSALPTSRAAKQAFILDLMKLGFIDPNTGLEVMEIGGLGKVYEKVQVDVRQAQRENLRMAQVTQEQADAFQSAQQDILAQDVGRFFDPSTGQTQSGALLSPTGEIRFPLLVPVNTWDDHRIHIATHNKYRKSQAYDQLDPASKRLFENHVQYHVEQILVGQMSSGPTPVMPEAANSTSIAEGDQIAAEQSAPGGAGQVPPNPGGESSGIPFDNPTPSG